MPPAPTHEPIATATPVGSGPPNDDISAATLIGSFPHTAAQDTTGATVAEADSDMGVGLGVNTHTVWYRFVAPSTGLATADTFGSSYDTVLAAFSGSPGNLTLVVGNDDVDASTLASQISFAATQGTIYYLEAAGFNQGGTLRLNVALVAAPPNDDIGAATPIGSFPLTATQDTAGATVAATDPDMGVGFGVNTNTVWYSVVAPSTGFVAAETYGSFYDTVLAAFSGSPGNLALVASNDDADATTVVSRISFAVTGGTTYYLEAAGFDEGGDLRLTVDFSTTPFPSPTAIPTATPTATATATGTALPGPAPTYTATPLPPTAVPTSLPPAGAPPNDDIGAAIVIGGFPYSGTLDTSKASLRPTDPNMGVGMGLNLNTAWYRFVAPGAGGVTADTFGSNYDTVLAAFSGGPGNLAWVASNDDDAASDRQSRIVFDVVAGTTYYLLVGGYEGGGNLRLNVAFSTTPYSLPANDDYDSATTIGGSPFTAILDSRGATVADDDPEMTASSGVNSNSVWYRFTAPVSGRGRASTFSSDYDTVLAVFTGTRGNLTPVAANDDVGSSLQSEVAFDVEAGTTYHLEVAGYQRGNILRLAVEFTTPTPTATPAPTAPVPSNGGGGGGNGGGGGGGSAAPAPEPVETPRAPEAPRAGDVPRPGQTPGAGDLPEPRLVPAVGTAIPVTVATEMPAGVPIPGVGGMVAMVAAMPGTGVVTSGNLTVQVGNDRGRDLAVLVQLASPVPPRDPEVQVLAAFQLAVYSRDQGAASYEKSTDTPVVMRVPLSQAEFNALAQQGKAPSFQLVKPKADGTLEYEYIETHWSPEPAPGCVWAEVTPQSLYQLVAVPAAKLSERVARADARYFRETGYRVNRDAFWDYFQKRGGVRTFGYPISREFRLLGFEVQMFQRAILQRMPEGGVARMNLLDEGLMPYNRINSSGFPAPNLEISKAAPLVADPEYAQKAIAFVRANAPDQWEGMPVNFLQTFLSTVRYEDAFPEGGADPSLVPLLNLELWGLPTSKPAYDPNNRNFVYQRFQRGIMHYDASTGATQGLLLADYLKSIITGKDLPSDLAEQARESRFFKQYDLAKPKRLARPDELGGTDLGGAFEPEVPQEVVASALSADVLLVSVPILGAMLLGIRLKGGRRRK